jgi:CubicO group peptidase (beta-lactamase class C family)
MPPLSRSYGVTDLEWPTRIDSTSIFEAGSVSKQITAAAVLLLSYDGKLSLDDDVRRWIPELNASPGRITIRDLLHHQAGLRDWGDIVELSGWPRGTRVYQMREIIALIARQRARNFDPGVEYSYSNSNYVMAAAIVERASGEALPAFTARRIFTPLGMTHTSWRDDYSRRVAHRTVAWTPDDTGAWHEDMPFENVIGHAALLTTVHDLLRWQDNFSTGTVGGPRFATDMRRAGVLRDGRVTGYALGLEIGIESGASVVSHGGATAGYRAYLGEVPATGARVALLCNNGAIRSDLLGPQLLAMANGDTSAAVEEAPPALGPAATEGARAALTGQFRNLRTGQTVQLRPFRDGVTLNTWVGFRASGPNTFLSFDSARTLTVTAARNRSPMRFRIAYNSGDAVEYERADPWTPATAKLHEFVGTYASPDADATWALRVDRDTLRVTRRTGQTDDLVPAYRDAFRVPSQGWLVTFRRDTRGRVTGLDVRTTRMRAMRFIRA